MNNDEYFKLPRLFIDSDLMDKTLIPLAAEQAHYLYNVLRRKNGNQVRLFNGKHGEWLGTLTDLSKKIGYVQLNTQLKTQPVEQKRIHLIFAPIKKNRMDLMIEKAVELGVTDLHPILTQNTEVRKINAERVNYQIFEAAEQCERFVIPTLHPLIKVEKLLSGWDRTTPILACIERYEAQLIQDIVLDADQGTAFLIGPEGGFTGEEKDIIAKNATAVSLGETILRCETAALKALVLLNS
jgi:16S rRNA (uracil1498-N3)-methyltransferase